MNRPLPYENQIIGVFLYALGYAEAARVAREGAAPTSDRPLTLNLFQQTPLDSAFSDLVVGRDQCLVIEFKRSAAEFAAERGKDRATLRNALVASPAFKTQSAHGHHVVYARPSEHGVELRCCTYLDVLGLLDPPKLDRGSAEAMVRVLVDPKPGTKIGLAPPDMVTYLDRLRRLRAEQVGTGGRAGTEAWLGLARGADGLKAVVASSLDALLGLDLDRGPTQTQELPEPERNRGMDLGR